MKEEIKSRIYKWSIGLIKLIDGLDKNMSSQVIAKQVLRSGTSVGANYVEAQAASSRKDFINFIHYSLKSANESKYWLCLLRDSNKIKGVEFDNFLDELDQISKILGASLIKLKRVRNLTF